LLPIAVEHVLVQRNILPVVELLKDVYCVVVSLHSAFSVSPSV